MHSGTGVAVTTCLLGMSTALPLLCPAMRHPTQTICALLCSFVLCSLACYVTFKHHWSQHPDAWQRTPKHWIFRSVGRGGGVAASRSGSNRIASHVVGLPRALRPCSAVLLPHPPCVPHVSPAPPPSPQVALLVALGFILGRHHIGHIFTSDPGILDLATELSPLCGACYVMLCLGLMSLATLDAQCRPATMAGVFFFGGWLVSLPLAWVLAFKVTAVRLWCSL